MELNDDLDKDYEDYAQTFDDSERDNEDDNGDDDNDDDDDLQSMCACVELTKTALPSEIGGGVAQPCINFIIFTYLHIYIGPGRVITITWGTYLRRTPLLE